MLSAVFEAYERREFPDDIVVRGLLQQRLGERVHYVRTDIGHASRVRAGLIEHAVSGHMRPFGRCIFDDRSKGAAIHVFVRYE
ncbi:MAG: hypothetical protein ACLTQI_00600 [Slackia sp.]